VQVPAVDIDDALTQMRRRSHSGNLVHAATAVVVDGDIHLPGEGMPSEGGDVIFTEAWAQAPHGAGAGAGGGASASATATATVTTSPGAGTTGGVPSADSTPVNHRGVGPGGVEDEGGGQSPTPTQDHPRQHTRASVPPPPPRPPGRTLKGDTPHPARPPPGRPSLTLPSPAPSPVHRTLADLVGSATPSRPEGGLAGSPGGESTWSSTASTTADV
jgi:hypothetical protein